MAKPFKIGILGAGTFANHFIPLFQAHPLVAEVAFAECMAERRNDTAEKHGISADKCYESFEELLQSDVDAVGIFTQRWTHAPQAIQAMRAGKHVYSAVPAAISLAEIEELIDTVKETGQIYMLGETTYYGADTILCRKLYRRGAFGRFVYGEAAYHHDMEHGFYPPYRVANGEGWKKFASFPPMLYPTHSIGQLLGVTGGRMTQVSCFGQVDDHHDGIFDKDLSYFGNDFSNQCALLRSDNDGLCRASEFRRVTGGHPLTVHGTEAAFNNHIWHRHDKSSVDLFPLLKVAPMEKPDDWEEQQQQGAQEDFFAGVSAIHDSERLPESFNGKPNGHGGSHQFLADDFVKAVYHGYTPVLNVWAAARYCAPGIIAHQSSLKNGETMSIPDFGEAPVSLTIRDLEEESGKEPPAACLKHAHMEAVL